jgi:hypothetical protein
VRGHVGQALLYFLNFGDTEARRAGLVVLFKKLHLF